MSASVLETFLVPRRVPPRRRAGALVEIKPRLEAQADVAEVMDALGDAIDAHHLVVARLALWEGHGQDDAFHEDGAVELDRQADHQLSSILASLRAAHDGHDPESASAQAAARLIDAEFASGVYPTTSKPFSEQFVAVDAQIGRLLRTKSHSADLDTLGLRGMVERLARINEAYGRAINRPERIAWSDVKEADATAWRATLRFYARLAGRFSDLTPEDDAILTDVLEPMRVQEDQWLTLRKRKANGNGNGSGPPTQEQAADEDPDALGDDSDADDADDVDLEM